MLKKSPLKGPLFPSMKEPPSAFIKWKQHPDRALPRGDSWLSHSGRKARLRYLRQYCGPALKTKESEIVAVLAKLRETVKDEPEPEYGFLHILFHALKSADDTGVSLVDAVNYMLQKWADIKNKSDDEVP